MRLPKQPWGTRYNGSTDYNTQVTFIQPNNGNAVDGTPLPEVAIATTWANVSMWRGKQNEKEQTLQAVSSYKIIVRYPSTWTLDPGMSILVRRQLHNIEGYADPDGNRQELHIWTWVGDDTVGK